MKNNKQLVKFYGTIILIIAIMGLVFVVKNLATGFYIEELDFLYCTSEDTCYHERAHQMDKGTSETEEYREALKTFAENNPDWLNWYLHNSPKECYAQMWENAGGNINNIPPELQEFYK